MNDFFNTLGIEATKEEKEIKKVEKAKTTSKNINDENVIEDDFVIDKKGDFEYGR